MMGIKEGQENKKTERQSWEKKFQHLIKFGSRFSF
jgi:hypothetical protein